LGANDYLIKSQFDIDQVVDKIKGILEKPKSAPAPEGQPSL
jgi:hypothetical protein